METLILTEKILSILKKIRNENSSLGKFFKDFEEATIRWIRPLFLKDETNQLDDFIDGKDNDLESLVKSKIEYTLKKNDEVKKKFSEIVEQIENSDSGFGMSIKGDKNVQISKSNNNSINIQ